MECLWAGLVAPDTYRTSIARNLDVSIFVDNLVFLSVEEVNGRHGENS